MQCRDNQKFFFESLPFCPQWLIASFIPQTCSTWYLYLYSSCTRVQVWSTCTCTCTWDLSTCTCTWGLSTVLVLEAGVLYWRTEYLIDLCWWPEALVVTMLLVGWSEHDDVPRTNFWLRPSVEVDDWQVYSTRAGDYFWKCRGNVT